MKLRLLATALSFVCAYAVYGDCTAAVTSFTVTDPPTQTTAFFSVSYSLTGTGNLSIYRKEVATGSEIHLWGLGISGTGTFAGFAGGPLAQLNVGDYLYRAVVTTDCHAGANPVAAEETVARYYDPRPTATGTIASWNSDHNEATVAVDYTFPYIFEGGGAGSRQLFVDGGGGAQYNLQPGEPWQGQKLFTVTIRCLGTGTHSLTYRAVTAIQGSPAEPDRFTITQAKITGVSAQPSGSAGATRVTVSYAFEATLFPEERRIEVFFNGDPSAIYASNVSAASGTVSFDFTPACAASGTLKAVAIACGNRNSTAFRDEMETTIATPVETPQVAISKLLDTGSGNVQLTVTHSLPPGLSSATRTVRVLSIQSDNGVTIPGSILSGPSPVTSSTPPLTLSYTPPVWARTIRFQATLSACNGLVHDETTWECGNGCNQPQPPTATPHPMSFEDGNAHYADGDPLPPLLDSFALARSYDSHHRVRGAFGRGWVSMFDNRLYVDATEAGSVVSLSDERNESFMFLLQNGVYTQIWPRGRNASGTLSLQGSLYVHRPAGASLARLYRSSDGRFAGYRQLGTGREMLITYDANGVPLSVKDSWTDLTWTLTVSANRITSIAAGGLTWQYQYVNDNLTGVLAPGGNSWRTYEYNGNLLTAARDPLGHLIEGHTYDAGGRATGETGPEDEITSMTYGAAGTTSTQLVTQVTTKAGALPEYTLRPIGGSWRTVKITGGCASCGARDGVFAYDSGGHLTREQNAGGYVTVRTYAGDRLVSMQEHLRPAACDPEQSSSHCLLTPDTLPSEALAATPATLATTYEYGDLQWPDKPTAIATPALINDQPRREELTYHPVTGEVVAHRIAGIAMTAVALYGDAPASNDDGGAAAPYAPAFNPGGTFSSAWLDLPQPPLRKSIDGPRSDVADVISFVYYPVHGSVPAALRGRLAAVRNAAGHITRYESYDLFGNATRVVDPNGVAAELTYDSLGRLLTSTTKGVSGCDTAADPLCATDLTTTRVYASGIGPLASEERPGGGVTTYDYDDRGRVAILSRGTANNLRERIEYAYDPLTGRKSLEKFSAKEGTSWIEKHRESYAYDSLAQLRTITHADAATVEYTYDEQGRIAGVQDENHAAPNTFYAYDPAGRLALVKQTLGTAAGGFITTQYAYDVHGNLAAVTDPNGNVTAYQYDDRDRMTRQVSPVTGTTSYAYDDAGNLVRSVDANSMVTERAYDALNRVIRSVSSPSSGPPDPPPSRDEEPPPPPLPGGAETVLWTYDGSGAFALGRLASMSDPAGETAYTYERRGLLTGESRTIRNCQFSRESGTQCTSVRTDSTGFSYDADGNRTALVYPSGVLTVHYTYDYAGRPLSAGGAVTAAEYLPFGPLTKLQFANGTTQTMQYDSRYRMTSNTLSQTGVPGNPGVIAGYGYDYDAAGNILHLRDVKDADYQRHFAYDDLHRLVRADTKGDTPNQPSPLWGKGEYTWDAMGNILTAKLNEVPPQNPGDPELAKTNPKRFRPPDRKRTATAIVQPLGREMSFSYVGTTPVLAAVTLNDLSHPVTHDAAGNELSYVATRTYSPRNLLKDVTDSIEPGEILIHKLAYAYDGRGVRIARTESPSNDLGTSATRYYVYTPELQLLAGTREDGPNVWGGKPPTEAANNIDYELVWFGSRPVAQLSPGNTPLYTFTDHLGTPILQTDPARAIAWRVEYEPFGNVYDVREGLRTDQPLRLPGQELAMTFEGPEENYNVFRWYKGGWGRYTSPDPIQVFAISSSHAFGYAAGNPSRYIDPFGLYFVRDTPANPNENTIVCRGGEIVTQIITKSECLRDCVALHESIHAARARSQNSRMCEGKADGLQIGFDEDESGMEELFAYRPTFKCLLQRASADACCVGAILDYINNVLQPRHDFFVRRAYEQGRGRRLKVDQRLREVMR